MTDPGLHGKEDAKTFMMMMTATRLSAITILIK